MSFDMCSLTQKKYKYRGQKASSARLMNQHTEGAKEKQASVFN